MRELPLAFSRLRLPVLARYVLAAVLARTATGGSAVAVILLANAYGASGKAAGILAACLTMPHLLGPLFGRWLDRVADARLLIAATALIYAVFFPLAVQAFAWPSPWLIAFSLLICGTCSSFLMGGLSTQLAPLVGADKALRRRAMSWDTISYGIGLTLGPMLIALLCERYSIPVAVTLLTTLPLFAAVAILSFPKGVSKTPQHHAAIPSVKQVVALFGASHALRKTLLMTSAAAFSVAALPVLAVYLSESWHSDKQNGAYLVTSYGVGSLCGSLLLMFRPLMADALLLLRKHGGLLLAALVLLTLSSSYNAGLFSYWLCGVINACFFAATLAARSEYAPEGSAAQVYMWVAAAKIGAASLGALAAGYWVDASVRLPLVLSASVLALTLLLCFWRRPVLAAQS
ncbi:MFS transporter [Bowmanella dokdonensis]|uniref:MFS transporter n=1 Tax=Bowmanella dokdonensis TaxID=751969 RepID=A0A939IMX4_9ALTE|nr:MFS transporter [Bowmanella dokdonensis]MBN7825763.1 MFS transporter [Bowmanella dokdonensis]